MIGILDYNCGNLASVKNALNYLQVESTFINASSNFDDFSKIILPGVGSFDTAMNELNKDRLGEAIKTWVADKNNTLLGICLGMQLLCKGSEESVNKSEGLGLIDAECKLLRANTLLTLPNIGWSDVRFKDTNLESFTGDYYFVHSYGVNCNKQSDVLCTSFYGDLEFHSGITNNKNVYGFQFHPEKSNVKGLHLLNWFCNI